MQSLNFSAMKFFTFEEARAVLPEVKALVEKLVKTKKALDTFKNVEIEFDDPSVAEEINLTKINKDFHRWSYQFFDCLDSLEEMGCVVKDVDNGLIDFYSIVDGKEVFFCWKAGESDIAHWHDLDAGFRGRMPIGVLGREVKKEK